MININFVGPNQITEEEMNMYFGFGTAEVMYLFKFFAEFLLLWFWYRSTNPV